MSEYNFGIIKATFTNYLNESEDILAKESFKKFMQLIKESALLSAEFKVFKNLEERYQPNDILASKFIDDNISQFNSTPKPSSEYFNEENSKLKPLIEGLKIRVSNKKKELYEHIHTLLFEHSKGSAFCDTNKIHESHAYVMEYIKNNKPSILESTEDQYASVPKDFLVKRAIDIFNEKFSNLNEDDKQLFKIIISEDTKTRGKYFSDLRSNILTKLSEYNNADELIDEAVEKVTKMSFNESTYIKDVLTLSDFNENLNKDLSQG